MGTITGLGPNTYLLKDLKGTIVFFIKGWNVSRQALSCLNSWPFGLLVENELTEHKMETTVFQGACSGPDQILNPNLKP